MNDNNMIRVYSNDLVRYITSRSYFYLYRQKVDNRYVVFYKDSPLLREIINLYHSQPKSERNSFVSKDKQKAE